MTNSTISYILATIVGAIAVQVGAWLNHKFTMQREQKQWERQQKAEQQKQKEEKERDTYAKVIRLLMQAKSRRLWTLEDRNVIDISNARESIENLTESQLELTELIALTHGKTQDELTSCLQQLEDATNRLIHLEEQELILSIQGIHGSAPCTETESILSMLSHVYQMLVQTKRSGMK